MVAVLWAYEGWQYTTFIAGETIDPQRNFPWGIGMGTLALIVIYLAAVLAYVAGIGPDAVAASNRVAADATSQVLGPMWGKLIAIPIIISMLSAAHGNTLTSSRVYYAMARDGVFFRKLGEIHPKFGTPAFAIATSTTWAAVLALSGTFETLLTYVVFVGWIFYGLAGLAVIPLRRKHPEWPRPYKVPGYPYLPILFVLSAAAIVINTIWDDPKKGVIGVGAALLGIPVYLFWNRNRPSPSPEA
jgi:APA family basic amino acid/polyamine antiporter